MTFDEYKKLVQPGRRVFVMSPSNGGRMYGTAAHMYGTEGVEYVIRFDNGAIGKVTEKSVGIVQLEEAN